MSQATYDTEQYNILDNPMGTDGFEFIEFAAIDLADMDKKFRMMGFVPVAKHRTMEVYRYTQGDINFIVNVEPKSHSQQFARFHGASVSAMGFRVKNAKYAYERAIRLGARAYQGERGSMAFNVPAIYGIGESLIYFIDEYTAEKNVYHSQFAPTGEQASINSVGLTYLDHVTHNVFKGQMDTWAKFYQQLFNFRQIRYFDIKGKQTGLISRAMTSPCGKIRIPLNESVDDKSQIEEYLRDYNGEGIQHIALGSSDIYHSVLQMRLNGLRFLKTPLTYYEQLEHRIPNHKENVRVLQENRILIDGSIERGEGLLLQIFTQNLFGPVFFEIIQRKGNEGFGEGNFQALFVAMELDQIRRGVLKEVKQ